MRIDLIVPAVQENPGKKKRAVIPPLGMAMVAALTPPDVQVSLTDENVTPVDFEKEVDLVGITALTLTAERAYRIADTLRARGVKVVLGGMHPSALPQEASRHADAVVIGEAEEIWPGLIEDFKANKLRRIYKRDKRPSLVGLPIPRRDLYAGRAYFLRNTIAATRGCPHSCSFCAVSGFFGRTYRCRPVNEILEEIETLNRGKIIVFVDDNIVGNPKFAKELFRALVSYKIRWAAQCSLAIARDEELLNLAAASGCIALIIGFESLSTANLTTINKNFNVPDEYEDLIRRIHSRGIAIHGTFIIGLDEDEKDVFERTLHFAQKTRLETAAFSVPTPLPGTALYESLDKAGRIVTSDWSQYESNIVFEPKLMSPEDLRRGREWILREFFSLPSIWRRIGIRHQHLAWVWAANLGYWVHYRRRF